MQPVTTRSSRLIGKAGVPGGVPVSEFLLIPFGPITVERALSGGDFTFTRADALRPAAGWIGKLQVRADGLWAADVEWTEKARALLATGQYRYFSPVIYWADDNWGELTGLGPVALTNDPAMSDVVPLAASRGRQLMVGTVLTGQRLALVGKLDPEAGDDGDQGSQFSPEDESRIEDAAALFRAALENVEGMINTLNESLGELDRFFEHFSAEDKKRFRMLAHHAENAEKRQRSAEQLEEVGWTAASRQGPPSDGAALVARARREFAASRAVREEFGGDVAVYTAYRQAEADGRVRILGSRATTQRPPARPSTAGSSPGCDETVLKRMYETSPALQREFGEYEVFAAYTKHARAGHVQILGAKR